MSDLVKRLRELEGHNECDDCWYSCPAFSGYCGPDESKRCDCGANYRNALHTEAADRIERLETALRELEAHHAANNNAVGRPQECSKTLRIIRAALQDNG